MSPSPAFVAIDWGTSSFRLWLMGADGTVLAERRSGDGLLSAARTGFEAVLDGHLSAWPEAETLPVVVCGMAGSRQGWVEAGYIPVPADVAGICTGGVRVPVSRRHVTILPGLALGSSEDPDVMRGEETQLLGAVLETPGSTRFCMPGTHSKWVSMEATVVTGFQTFMTGELYSILSQHSILSHSIGETGDIDPTDRAFLTGVRDAWSRPAQFTHQLFSIRAGQLLHDRKTDDNRARLSGLTIGVELAGAGVGSHEEVALVASGRLGALYRAALDACETPVRSIDADVAVRRGLLEAWRRDRSGGRKNA